MTPATWIALAALLASLIWNAVQFRDRQLTRRPRVVIDVRPVPGASSWPDVQEGQFTGEQSTALYVSGTIHVAGSAVITGARLAPAVGEAPWDSLPEPDIYVGDPTEPDSGRRESGMGVAQIPDEHVLHRLPRPVGDGQIVIRAEYSRPLPSPIRESDGARLWVETDTGNRFLSPVGQFTHRYRGPRD